VEREWGTYQIVGSNEKNKKKGRKDLGSGSRLIPKHSLSLASKRKEEKLLHIVFASSGNFVLAIKSNASSSPIRIALAA
jgi:hypothetical protein